MMRDEDLFDWAERQPITQPTKTAIIIEWDSHVVDVCFARRLLANLDHYDDKPEHPAVVVPMQKYA